MAWRGVDDRLWLLSALLVVVACFDVLVLPVALSPAAPPEAARLAELGWWALWLAFGLALARCAFGGPFRPGRSAPCHNG